MDHEFSTGNSGADLFLFHDIESSTRYLIVRGWNHLKAHSLTHRVVKTGYWLRLSSGLEWEDLYVACSRDWVPRTWIPRKRKSQEEPVSCLYSSLRNHILSLPPHPAGWNSSKLAQIQGERKWIPPVNGGWQNPVSISTRNTAVAISWKGESVIFSLFQSKKNSKFPMPLTIPLNQSSF